MKLSAQCYTVRDEIERDLWGTIGNLKKLGLNYIEIGGTFGVDPREFMSKVKDLGLRISGNHVSIEQVTNDLAPIIQLHGILETPYVVLSSVNRDRYGQGWASVALLLSDIGAKFKEAGLIFCYHNHSFEFQTENGKPGLDVLYENSDPRFLNAQLDTYWVAHGGADPAAYIRKMKGRVPVVHLKDGKTGGEPIFLEVGQGELDWVDILKACDEAGVEFGAIEQDTCDRPPMESVKMSVDFLRAHGVTE